MPNIPRLMSQLRQDEGERLEVYKDSLGYLTAGVGHLVRSSDELKLGDKITQQQSDDWFKEDVEIAVKNCMSYIGYAYNFQPDVVQECLINMVFNMGVSSVAKFVQFLGLIQGKAYKTAAKDLEGTLWYKQVGSRAVRICNTLRSVEPTNAITV